MARNEVSDARSTAATAHASPPASAAPPALPATLPVSLDTRAPTHATRLLFSRLAYKAIVLAVVIIPLLATGLAIWLL